MLKHGSILNNSPETISILSRSYAILKQVGLSSRSTYMHQTNIPLASKNRSDNYVQILPLKILYKHSSIQ